MEKQTLTNEILNELKFDDRGLIVAIAQDYENGQVLMQAYMNREAIEKTIETGYAHYYSRSRQTLWLKGEESGHLQKVREIYLDCDGDAILLKVEQKGPACHTGRRSCFYRKVEDGQLEIVLPVLVQPEEAYLPRFLLDLYKVILDRKENADPKKSYVKSLMVKGREKIHKKIFEEAYEFARASDLEEGTEKISNEAADLLFHFLIALGYEDISPIEVLKVLKSREGVSGLEEKKRRRNR